MDISRLRIASTAVISPLRHEASTADAVLETVDLVKNHPLMPADVTVRGYIMDSTTGALQSI